MVINPSPTEKSRKNSRPAGRGKIINSTKGKKTKIIKAINQTEVKNDFFKVDILSSWFLQFPTRANFLNGMILP
jgi:hypothetical protein